MQPQHAKELKLILQKYAWQKHAWQKHAWQKHAWQKHAWQKHAWRLAVAVALLSCAIWLGYALKTASAGFAQVKVMPDNLPPGMVGEPYRVELTASGGMTSYAFSMIAEAGEGLPLGLSLEKGATSDVAVLSGTPQEPGIFSFMLVVTSPSSTPANKRYILVIRARPDCPGLGLAVVKPDQFARLGAAYSQTFNVIGGTAPYSFTQESRLSERLPKGLELKPDSDRGQVTLAGLPEEVGSFSFTLRVEDARHCYGLLSYELQVSPGNDCPISMSPDNLLDAPGFTCKPYSLVFTGCNIADETVFYAFSLDLRPGERLPRGLEFKQIDKMHAGLSGTPEEAGSFNFTIKVSDSLCAATKTFTLVIRSCVDQGIICPEINLTPQVLFDATVTKDAPYSQLITAQGGESSYTFTAENLPEGLHLERSSADQYTLRGNPSKAGSFEFTITAKDKKGCVGTRTYVLGVRSADDCQVITLAPETLPCGEVETDYRQILTARPADGNYSFALVSGALPPGLALGSNGLLIGKPTQAGTFDFTITANKGHCSGCQAYRLCITPTTCSSQKLTVNPLTLSDGVRGAPYPAVNFSAQGGSGAYAFRIIGRLPDGLKLSANGVLSGTPTESGVFPITVIATSTFVATASEEVCGSRAYVLLIKCPNSSITLNPPVLPTGTLGEPYKGPTFTASGGKSPYIFTLLTALPRGMSFANDILSGIPEQAGLFSPITVVATDADGCVGKQDYTLAIKCPEIAISISPPAIPEGLVNEDYGPVTFSATGGSAPYKFKLDGTLPNGMSFSEKDATLSGTPTQTGVFPLRVSASSADECRGKDSHPAGVRDYVLVVACSKDSATANSVPITITITQPPSLPSGTVGVFYTATPQFGASGGVGPYTFGMFGLPEDLKFSAGVLSGIPTAVGNFVVTVVAKDANGCPGSRLYTLTIAAPVPADLSISKTDGKTAAVPGQTVTYTITASNAGPNAALGATVTDLFPATVTGVTWVCTSAGGGTCPANGAGNINAPINLPVGSSVTFIASGTLSASATGTLVNTATVTPPGGVIDPNNSNNSATDTDTLTPQADLSVTKTNGASSVVAGTPVSYTITASNTTGPSNVIGATVTDTFPATLTGVTWTCTSAGGGSCPANGAGNLNATVNLPVGGSVTFKATGTLSASATGTLVNTATVTPPNGATDPNNNNNSATDTDTITQDDDLAISKTDGVNSVVAGTPITYTITASNIGPSSVSGATVADNFPASLTGVTWTCTGTGGGTCPPSGVGNINEKVDLPAGGSVTFKATGTLSASATGTLSNTATVTPPNGATDPNNNNNSATDTDTIIQQADLAISKTNGVNSVVAGLPVTYTITASNNGPSSASGILVTDNFPATFTGVTWTCTGAGGGSCPANGAGNINAIVNLPVGSSVTFKATGTLSASATGTLVNTATVTVPGGATTPSDVTDPNNGNNSATDTDPITQPTDLAITKTNGVNSVVAGTPVTYTITASNVGPNAATGAMVTDNFPATLTGITWTCTGAGGGTCPANGSGNLNATVNLPVGSSVTFKATGTLSASAAGTLVNTATVTAPSGVTDTNDANNSASDTDQITKQADLTIIKTNNANSVVAGTPVSYTITVSNNGPSNVSGATVTDNFPATLSGVTWTCVGAGGGSCPANGTGNINALVNLPVGGSAIFTATGLLSASATGTLANTATVTPPNDVTDPNDGNNSATDTDTITQRADLAIGKTSNVDRVLAGLPVSYTITASNNGPSSITGATVADVFPTTLTGVTWTCTGAGGGSCPANGAGDINAPVNLPVGGSVIFKATGTLSSSATGTLSNTATVTPPNGATDPNSGNNSATDTKTIEQPTDLAISKTNGVNSVVAGTTVSYTITASNSGPSNVSGATVTDNFPATLTGVTWTCTGTGGATCPANGAGNINALINLPVGGSVSFTATGTLSASATGTLVNTATVTPPSGVSDINNANNSATDTDPITQRADLAISKTNNVNGVVAGTAVSYTITASNTTGPSNVTGATVTDTFPATLTDITWTCTPAGGATCPPSGAGNISATVNLPANSSVTFKATGTLSASATGTLVNTATVSVPSGVSDINDANNSATDTDPITQQAELAISKTDGVNSVVAGTPVSYTITASNTGPSNVSGATVTDTFPASLTGVTWTCTGAGGGVCPPSGAGNINALVNLPVNSSVTFKATGTLSANATGTLVNTATVTPPSGVTDLNNSNNSATDTDQITKRADLAISKTDGVNSVVAGSQITYTITVSNTLGPSDVSGALVIDNFPATLTVGAWTCTGAGGATCPASGTGNINALVNLPVGGSVIFTVPATLSASATGTLVNTATVTPPNDVTDPNSGNNSATDTDTILQPTDLAISKTNGVNSVVAGAPVSYTITASNNGPNSVNGATVTDTFPATLTGVTWTCTGTGGGSCPANGSGNLNATVNLPTGGAVIFTATGTLSASALGTLSNTATVSAPATVSDQNPANNSATDTDPIIKRADLLSSRIDGATRVAGLPVSYTITVSNAGPSDVSGAMVTDNFPAALSGVSWTCTGAGGGSCPANGAGNINALVNLPVNSSVTFKATGTLSANATGTLVNTLTITPPNDVTDPDSGNNSATITDQITQQAELAISKTDGVDSVIAGTPVTYTITASNTGPSSITGATVADVFPTTLSGVTWTCTGTGGGTCPPNGTGNLNALVNLQVGGSVIFTATGTLSASATGTLVNTATVTPPNGATDPNSANNSATDTDTILQPTDLAISKTNGVNSVVAGTGVTYTITVSNNGPSAATGAMVTDNFPVPLTGITWTCVGAGGATCPASGTGNINALVNLPVGSSVSFTATGLLSPSATGTLVNTARVTAPSGVSDTNDANNSATDIDTITLQADLAISKTSGVSTAAAGLPVSYTITVSNNGPSNVTGVLVTDIFPATLSGVIWSCTGIGGGGCLTSGVSNINVLVNLPVGSSVSFTATGLLSAEATGTLVNTATVTPPANVSDPNLNNNTAISILTILRATDLAITKTDGVSSYAPRGTLIYTVTVTNTGPVGVTGALVTDKKPLQIASWTWTCPGQEGGASRCTPIVSTDADFSDTINLPVGGTIIYTVTAQVSETATGDLVNTACVKPPNTIVDLNSSNDCATDTDTPVVQPPDVVISKTDGVSSVVAGTPVSYTITASNTGSSNVLGATVTDNFPATLSGVTWKCESTGNGFCQPSGVGNISAPVNLPGGSSLIFTATGTLSASATGLLSNTAMVTATNIQAKSATDTDTIIQRADLAISKSDGVDQVVAGTPVSYTITVSNTTGPSSINGVTVVDNFPALLTGVTWTCTGAGGGVCPPSGSGNLNATVNLPVNSSVTFTATGLLSADATGTLSNTATVTPPSDVTDLDNSNNSATDTDQIIKQADLAISKTSGAGGVMAGLPVSYRITASNTGPSNVTGATVVDNFPVALSGVTWTCAGAGGGTCPPSGVGNINAAVNLPRGGSVIFTATGLLAADASGTLVNTATVTAPGGVIEVNGINNSATVSDPINRKADLMIIKADGASSYTPGATIVYAVVVSNNKGPANVSGAVVTDAKPSQIVSWTWDCVREVGGASGCTPIVSTSADFSNTINLPVGSAIIYRVTAQVSVDATGNLVNRACIEPPNNIEELNPDDNCFTDTDTIDKRADLAISKTDGVNSVVAGTPLTYTITASNKGPSNVTGARVMDTFPDTLMVGPWTCTGAGGGTCPPTGNGNINALVNLPVGGSVTFTVPATLSASATGTLVNTATVTPPDDVSDPNSGNNSATDTDTIIKQADLAISNTNNANSVVAGTRVTYTITASNTTGPSNVTGAMVIDNFPLTGVTWTCTGTGGGMCPPSGEGNINVKVDLPVGGSVTFTASGLLSADATGTAVSTATVTPPDDVTDPNTGNNRATDTDPIIQQADLVISKTDGVDFVAAGTPVSYTITASNTTGPSSINGATVVDNFPATLTGVTWTCTPAGGGMCPPSGSGNLNVLVNLPVGGAVIFKATGTVLSNATVELVNTATVTPPNGATDPNEGNNRATDTDRIIRQVSLVISKRVNLPNYKLGVATNLVYTLEVTNRGPSDVSGIGVTDSAPSEVTFTAWRCEAAGGDGAGTSSCSQQSGPGNLNNVALTLRRGATATFTINATVSAQATGVIINTASAQSPSDVLVSGANNGLVTASVAITPLIEFEQAEPSRESPGKDLRAKRFINQTSVALNLNLKTIKHGGADDYRKLDDPTDRRPFFIRLIDAQGIQRPLELGKLFTLNPRESLEMVFDPLIPARRGSTPGEPLTLPDEIASELSFEQNGASYTIPLRASLGAAVKLVHPCDPKLLPVVRLERAGDLFIVDSTVYDPNLNLYLMRYQFFDQAGKQIEEDKDVGLSAGLFSQSDRGQSFRLRQPFSGALDHPEVASVRVVVYDRDTPGSDTATSGTIPCPLNAAPTQAAAPAGGALLVLPTLSLAPSPQKPARQR